MPPSLSWSFPPFRLDPTTGSLWRDDQLVPLPPKPLAVLATLVAQAPLVWQHTANGLRGQTILVRNPGARFSAKRIQELTREELDRRLPEAEHGLAGTRSLALLHCLGQQMRTLEQAVTKRLQHPPASKQLLSVDGIGAILAQTIVLESGDIGRFPTGGTYASYCRCVQSTKISHGKRKGQGNGNNGHPYLAWASMEAAPCALRFNPTVPRFSQRKQAKSPLMVARKAVAQTRSWACYSSMRDLGPCEVHTAFG
jgi:transposase